MTKWLSQQEKIAIFQSYISHYQSEKKREEEVEEAHQEKWILPLWP